MWSAPVVIFLPFFQRVSGIVQCSKQRFVQAFIPEFSIEALNESILLRLCGGNIMPINPRFLHPFQDYHTREFGAIIRHNCFGIPRSATIRSNSRATRRLDNEVSAASTRFSRLKSSISVKTRNRRPSGNASETKSRLQH